MTINTTWKSSRLAVLATFFANGALMSTWVSRIPAIQIKLSLGEGALGLVLLGLSAGVLIALSFSGGLVARFGSAKVTIVGGLAMCLTLPPLALTAHPIALSVGLFIFGGAMSVMDVAMNEQAVLVEREAGRSLMSSFHAGYSIGGLAGALLGAGMASIASLMPFFHFVITGILFGSVVAFSARFLLRTPPAAQEKSSIFRLPERALWGLGAVAFCSAIAEGAMADWSAVYLNKVFATTTALAALGFAAFSLTMTVGRVFGDALATRWRPEIIVRSGGLIATFGFLVAVLTQTPVIALVGFAAIGLGLSNIIPLSFSAAGNAPGIPASTGIAGVATIGYAGFLAGPPVIGLIAEETSLRIAFTMVTILVATLILTAKAVSMNKDASQPL